MIPGEIWAGGNLESELEYGNHTSAAKHGEIVFKKAATDLTIGWTIVLRVTKAKEIRGLRISPVVAMGKKEKLRVTHELTFGCRVTVPGKRRAEGQEASLESVNADTDRHKIPEWRLAGVITHIITRILGLRAKFGTQKRILLQKMDVKSAFRQVVVAPDRAVAFAYHLEDLMFVDFLL